MGTSFTTELVLGDTIYVKDIAYIVTAITDNLNLTVSKPFDYTQSGLEFEKKTDGFTSGTVSVVAGEISVIGSGTSFTTEFKVGDFIRVGSESRQIIEISNDILMSVIVGGFGESYAGVPAYREVEEGVIDATGQTLSSMLVCRVFREGGHALDTYEGFMGLLEIDFHYQINAFGSDEEFTKA